MQYTRYGLHIYAVSCSIRDRIALKNNRTLENTQTREVIVHITPQNAVRQRDCTEICQLR